MSTSVNGDTASDVKELEPGDVIQVDDNNVCVVIVKRLGEGTFGTTWMVVCDNYIELPKGKRAMALKLAKSAATSEETEFEAEIMTKIMEKTKESCPIVPLIKAFYYEGKMALLMPLMQGDLTLYATDTPLSASQVFGVGRKVIKLLQAMHHAGFAHLDLKADNLLLSFRHTREQLTATLRAVVTARANVTLCAANRARLAEVEQQLRQSGATLRRTPRHQLDSLEIKLGDVGLSCKTSEVAMYPGGTLGYMAPEAIFGGNCSEKLDVFALGVMLAELSTGEKLFKIVGASVHDQQINVLNQMTDLFGTFTPAVLETVDHRRRFFIGVSGVVKLRSQDCPSLPSLPQWVNDKLLVQLEWCHVDAEMMRKVLIKCLAPNTRVRGNANTVATMF